MESDLYTVSVESETNQEFSQNTPNIKLIEEINQNVESFPENGSNTKMDKQNDCSSEIGEFFSQFKENISNTDKFNKNNGTSKVEPITVESDIAAGGDVIEIPNLSNLTGTINKKKEKNLKHLSSKRTDNIQLKYTCSICKKAFIAKKYIEKHFKQKHISFQSKSKNYSCKICDQSFNSKGTLECHLSNHFSQRSYQCRICSQCFVNQAEIKDHLKIHLTDESNKCDICDVSFPVGYDLKTHYLIHSDNEYIRCPNCDKVFHTKQGLRKHLLKYHDNKLQRNLFIAQSNDLSHATNNDVEHSNDNDAVNLCNEIDEASYLLTQNNEHDVSETIYEASTNLPAHSNECDVVYGSPETNMCNICRVSFPPGYDLKNHYLIHTGDDYISCHYCKKMFLKKGKDPLHKHIKHCKSLPLQH